MLRKLLLAVILILLLTYVFQVDFWRLKQQVAIFSVIKEKTFVFADTILR